MNEFLRQLALACAPVAVEQLGAWIRERSDARAELRRLEFEKRLDAAIAAKGADSPRSNTERP